MCHKTVTAQLRIMVSGHVVTSITKHHESHYVSVLDNPPEKVIEKLKIRQQLGELGIQFFEYSFIIIWRNIHFHYISHYQNMCKWVEYNHPKYKHDKLKRRFYLSCFRARKAIHSISYFLFVMICPWTIPAIAKELLCAWRKRMEIRRNTKDWVFISTGPWSIIRMRECWFWHTAVRIASAAVSYVFFVNEVSLYCLLSTTLTGYGNKRNAHQRITGVSRVLYQ